MSARLSNTQNSARDSARLARSTSVPAFSSRGAQLSASDLYNMLAGPARSYNPNILPGAYPQLGTTNFQTWSFQGPQLSTETNEPPPYLLRWTFSAVGPVGQGRQGCD